MSKEDNREKYKEYDHRYYIKHIRPNSKIGKLETKISDLEAKLAGKDQAIESLEELNRSLGQNCNNDRKEIERLRELISDKEKEIERLKELVMHKTYNRNAVEARLNYEKNQLAIEQLEKVKEFVNDFYGEYSASVITNFIDKQINELKGINKTNSPTRR